MDFEDKYSMTDDKKIIVSKDAYAIGEMLDQLIKKIEQARLNLR